MVRHLRATYKRWMALTMIFSALAMFSSCENKREELARMPKQAIGVETARDVTIIYTIGDRTKSRITAPVMLRHVDFNPYIEFTETIHAQFFDESLQIESELKAQYAKYLESESKVFMRDSVVVLNVQGDTLYCQELYWDRNKTGHEFYTDKPVRIRTPTHIIDGDGLDAPQDFKSWHVINGRGIVRVPEDEL